jgi:acyl-CoA reductase-like NAD-dependent aldehyde dehydrogenase
MASTSTTKKPAAKKTEVAPSNGQAEKKQASSSRIKVQKTYKIFINGQFPRTESGRYYPITLADDSIVNLCLSSRKDIRNAVVAAREAQEKWAARAGLNRSQILYRLAEMLETRSAQFVEELQQLGSTRDESQKETEAAIDRLIYYAGWCDKFNAVFSSVNPVSSSHFNFSSNEATGVVTIMAPEESALLGLISVIAPVIAGGNTCVVLASENKALCAVTLAEVIATSDVPAGVVNILTGTRKELLTHMANHMDVNAVYLHSNNAEEIKQIETLSALNVKRARTEFVTNWLDGKEENPYRIQDFIEVKTTWHPIGI